jgi:hypothetical protein
MRIRFSAALKISASILGVIASISGCHNLPPSQLLSTQSDAQAAIAVLGVQNGVDTGTKCGACHSLTPELVRKWGKAANDTITECFSHLDAQTWETPTLAVADEAINCLKRNPGSARFSASRLGLMAMGSKLSRFEQLFKTAYGENLYRTEFTAFINQAGMPPHGADMNISEADFAKVLAWNKQGLPLLDTVLPTVSPTTCQSSMSEALSTHVTNMATRGWQARHLENGLMMFACSDNDPLNCFNQKKNDGTPRFPLSQETSFGQTWGKDSPETHIRVLHELGFSTSFWMRTSPDGRFVANGGGGNSGATATDLQDLLTEGGAARDIPVQADYDPSFLPDNSAFIFQGGSSGICPLSVLRDRSITSVDFTQPGCSRSGSGFGMSLYQSVGASLDGSDFVGVTGTFQGDGGAQGSYGSGFSSDGVATLTSFINDGTQYKNMFKSTVATPYQGDYALSPSNELLITRFGGSQLPLGYNIFKTSRETTAAGGIDFKISQVGTVCMKGKKGNMSMDERFWVTYGPVESSDFADFGFASATDPEFVKLVGKSENVFLYDLVTSKNYRVTRMGAHQFAQFSHFRADGWIVFMVADTAQNKHYVVASDAAVRILRAR